MAERQVLFSINQIQNLLTGSKLTFKKGSIGCVKYFLIDKQIQTE